MSKPKIKQPKPVKVAPVKPRPEQLQLERQSLQLVRLQRREAAVRLRQAKQDKNRARRENVRTTQEGLALKTRDNLRSLGAVRSLVTGATVSSARALG